MEPVEESAEEVGPDEGDKGEQETDLGSRAGGDLEAPEGKEPDVGEDGDPVPDEDVGKGLEEAAASGLAHGFPFMALSISIQSASDTNVRSPHLSAMETISCSVSRFIWLFPVQCQEQFGSSLRLLKHR